MKRILDQIDMREDLYFLHQPQSFFCRCNLNHYMTQQASTHPPAKSDTCYLLFLQTIYANFDFHYSICHLKQPGLAFPPSASRISNSFDFIPMDVWGNFHILTINGERYFLKLCGWFYQTYLEFLINSKSECFSIFKDFYVFVETRFQIQIKSIISDIQRDHPLLYLHIHLTKKWGCGKETSISSQCGQSLADAML